MGTGLFPNKGHRPSREKIMQSLGRASGLWDELLSFINKSYRIEGEFKYYGVKTGWAYRVHKAGKALVMLFFEAGGLMAQIVLNPAQTEKALTSGLSLSTNKMLKEAKVYHDGRWLFINLKTEKELEDVKKLLSVKRKPVD
jgi:hypothetical protein